MKHRRLKTLEIVPSFEAAQVPVRETAKVILSTDKEDVVFVAGKRGMLNLPGGGVDEGETPEEALLRELEEETGLRSDDIISLEKVLELQGPITPADGTKKIAHWTVFAAGIHEPVEKLSIPTASEITEITALKKEQCLADPRVLRMARSAIRCATPRDNRPPRWMSDVKPRAKELTKNTV